MATSSDTEHPAEDRGNLPVGSRDELTAARLCLLRDARHRLAIQLPLLGSELYSSAEELAELRRIATSGRGAEIRILLHDPASALRDDHRLIALLQRLPSTIAIRAPQEEHDLALTAAWLLNDTGGYLYQTDARVAQGRAARRDRAALAPLLLQFDARWEHAQPATMLQRLGI